jgi:hypothetical protein
MSPPLLSFSRLADTGLIAIRGPDARAFLHAQLSQNIASLAANRAPLAAWCDPRGRVRALFRVIPAAEGWLLATALDVVEPTLEALRRFVLRAAVALERAASVEAVALVGEPDTGLQALEIGLDTAPGAHCATGDLHWIRVGAGLVELVGPGPALRARLAALDEAPPATAELAAIRLGLPVVTAAQSAQYVPQMLNLDVLGAVAFDKGCYPGQEVVARTQNLGTVKRRLRGFTLESAPAPPPGAALVDASDNRVGEVNRAAADTHGVVELLAVVRLEALDAPIYLETRRDAGPLRPKPGAH